MGAVIGTRAKSGAIDRPGYVTVFDGANPAHLKVSPEATSARAQVSSLYAHTKPPRLQ